MRTRYGTPTRGSRRRTVRKDEFLAILAHELRNPLAPIRYALPLLATERLGGPATRALAIIGRQVDTLTRLVDDLLDVSRITRGRIELRQETVTIGSILAAAIETASPAIASGQHTLTTATPDEPIWVCVDPGRLSQAVTNLLRNSATYTPDGGQIHLEARCEDGQAVVRVRDNGIGITPEALPTVFEMFRPARRADRPRGGLGIGLAFTRQLIELHGGTITAHSAGVGQGAEFVIRLPVAVNATREDTGVAEADTQVIGTSLKVLAVDDNADFVELLATLVRLAGHDVRTAADGTSAVAAAMDYRPDVVLLDLGLPDMTGLEVARELRRRPETAASHLVAVTGWGQPEDRHQTQLAGFDAHLTKPTEPATVLQLLSAVQPRHSTGVGRGTASS